MIGDEVGMSERLPDGALSQFIEMAKKKENSEPLERIAVNLNFIVSPVNFAAETTIKMLVYIDGEEVEAGRIKAVIAPAPPSV